MRPGSPETRAIKDADITLTVHPQNPFLLFQFRLLNVQSVKHIIQDPSE